MPSRAHQPPSSVHSAPALVVRATPYGEADLVVQLLVEGRGRVGAFARGARRSQRRYGGALEPFGVVLVDLADRRGGDLADLRGASLLEPHLEIRGDLLRLAHAGYALEVARELMRERQANDPLFTLCRTFLGELSRVGARPLLLRWYELAALGAAGYAPVLEACARCGGEPATHPAFDVALGGVACEACAGPFAIRLDPASHRLLCALQASPAARAADASADAIPIEPIRRALHTFLDHHVPHALRSRAFLRDVGAPL